MSTGDSTICCQERRTDEIHYAREGEGTPTEAVVDALAAATGVDPESLPPLYESIDPEVLDRLFRGRNTAADATTMLGFTVDGWYVVVRGDGRISVCDAATSADPAIVLEGK